MSGLEIPKPVYDRKRKGKKDKGAVEKSIGDQSNADDMEEVDG